MHVNTQKILHTFWLTTSNPQKPLSFTRFGTNNIGEESNVQILESKTLLQMGIKLVSSKDQDEGSMFQWNYTRKMQT